MYATALCEKTDFTGLIENNRVNHRGMHCTYNFKEGFSKKDIAVVDKVVTDRSIARKCDGWQRVKEMYDSLEAVLQNKYADVLNDYADYAPKLNRASDVARDAEELEVLLSKFQDQVNRIVAYSKVRHKPQALLLDAMRNILDDEAHEDELKNIYRKAYAASMRRAMFYEWIEQSVDFKMLSRMRYYIMNVSGHMDSARYFYRNKQDLQMRFIPDLFDLQYEGGNDMPRLFVPSQHLFVLQDFMDEDVYRYMLSTFISALCGVYSLCTKPVQRTEISKLLVGQLDERRYFFMAPMMYFAAKLYARPHREDWLTCPMVELLLDAKGVLVQFVENDRMLDDAYQSRTQPNDAGGVFFDSKSVDTNCILQCFEWSKSARSSRFTRWTNAMSVFRLWPFVERSIEERKRNATAVPEYVCRSEILDPSEVIRGDNSSKFTKLVADIPYFLPDGKTRRNPQEALVKFKQMSVLPITVKDTGLPDKCLFITFNKTSNAAIPMFLGKTKYGSECVLVPSTRKVCGILRKLYGAGQHDDLQRESVAVNAITNPEDVSYNLLFCDVFNAVYDKDVDIRGFLAGNGGDDTKDTHPDNLFKQFVLY